MSTQQEIGLRARPAGVTVISLVNSLAACITVAFWLLVYLRMFAGRSIEDPLSRTAASATLGFGVADLLWAVPLLVASARGLWTMRAWGLLAAQMVNILWLYSMTVIWVRDIFAGTFSPGGFLFAPFAVIALWAFWYLWRQRLRFA